MKRTPILTIWALSLIMVILLANPDNVWFWISFFIFSCSSIYIEKYNPQNEMFRLLGTKRSFSQNETFFFSHP